MSDPVQQRRMRAYQAKSRGDRRSFKTELENAQILLAWDAGDLSEGQAAKALDVDRLTARVMRDDMLAAGLALADKLLPAPPLPPGG